MKVTRACALCTELFDSGDMRGPYCKPCDSILAKAMEEAKEAPLKESNTTTTAGETFSHVEHVDLARLVYKRFGRDLEAAAAAWRRMLGNSCPDREFLALVEYAEHTPHCEGDCA